jgi:hypothetical protein
MIENKNFGRNLATRVVSAKVSKIQAFPPL